MILAGNSNVPFAPINFQGASACIDESPHTSTKESKIINPSEGYMNKKIKIKKNPQIHTPVPKHQDNI